MKIAVKLDDNKNIVGINLTDEDTAERQAKEEGWTLVESDPIFSIENRFLWTVRSVDSKLVHISSNQTSEEEKNTVITNLTLQNLQQANEITELKKISTTQALQNLQNSKDKDEQQKVITNQTVQILELQKNVSDIKSATN